MKKLLFMNIFLFLFPACEEKVTTVTPSKKPVIYLVLGSTREGRSSDKIAKAVQRIASNNKDASFEIIDLKDFNLPFLYESVSPAQGSSKDNKIQAWSKKIQEADGVIFIVPEYNSSFPGVLKNALDVLYKEWDKMPTMFIGYSGGASGGSNALNHLKQVAKALHMKVISSQITIPQAWQALDDKGNFKDEKLTKNISNSINELIKEIKK